MNLKSKIQTSLKSEPDIELTKGELSSISFQVDDALESGLPRLTFPSDLELLFERETGSYRRNQVTLFLLIAVLIYDFFLFTDRTIISDIFETALITRLGVITPVMLILLALIRRGVSPVFRESSIAVLTNLAGFSLIFLIALSNDQNKIFYHPGIILVVTYSNLVVRLRFRYALVSSMTLFFGYILFYPNLPHVPPQVTTTNIAMLFCCNIMTLYANYALEHEHRISFLLTLRERIRQGELTSQNRKLTRLILLDPLTKLANRREIDDWIEQMGEEPHPNSLAIIMLDIDHFKKYNDTYGHPAGDECLRQVAKELRKAVHRRGDIVGRIGGEEFVVLLPESNMQGAARKAEEIRRGIFELSIPNAGSSVAPVLTISAGVSAGEIHFPHDVKKLLLDADQALYQAKTNGRNQVSLMKEKAGYD